jgi:hypothetical protein
MQTIQSLAAETLSRAEKAHAEDNARVVQSAQQALAHLILSKSHEYRERQALMERMTAERRSGTTVRILVDGLKVDATGDFDESFPRHWTFELVTSHGVESRSTSFESMVELGAILAGTKAPGW